MSIIDQLAYSLGRRDEVPNQELAKIIAKKKDKKAVKELIENLSNKNKEIHFDCIKVLYEIGEINPSLISDYIKDFVELMNHKNNRMIWGTMHALDAITLEKPKEIYAILTKIIKAADEGSVITRDHAVSIIIKLCGFKQYFNNCFSLYIEQLKKSPENQFPSYAEKAMHLVDDKNRAVYLKTLAGRIGDIESETKKKRVEKVIKKLGGR